MSVKLPGNGLLMAATGCVIGLAILNELMELNRNIKMERTVIVPVDPAWAANEIAASDVVIEQAGEAVNNVRKRNAKGHFVKDEPFGATHNVDLNDKIN